MGDFIKKITAILLIAALCFSLTGCFGKDDEEGDVATFGSDATSSDEEMEASDDNLDQASGDSQYEEASAATDETWAIYWYLCGSDLESVNGAATADLEEMMEVQLPENVTVVIQTGGASQWQNEVIDPSEMGRYVYGSNGFEKVGAVEAASMGDSDVLADFLSYCKDNYPADRTMALFWNHGGGSVSGSEYDENFDNDSLTLDEMSRAFETVFGNSQPLEVVGFDTCLMATIDNAYMLSPFARYLVASEELEPGNGWYYTGWLGALGKNPGMNGEQLGKVICDSYVEGCEMVGTADEITLSVIDLSKIDRLVAAYDNVGKEAIAAAVNNTSFFNNFGRAASKAENYGGNTRDQGYTNMVDLGDLVTNAKTLLPENAKAVQDALNDCVVYKVNGPYRRQSTGISCYYSYNGDVENFIGYNNVGAGIAFKHYFGYLLQGELSDETKQYISEMGYTEISPVQTLQESLSEAGLNLEDYPVTVDEDGYGTLDLGAEIADMLTDVFYQLYYVDEEKDLILMLGRDDDIDADWDNGVFKDNFRGVWGAIDGNLVYMEIVDYTDDYNLYSVPIKLNGQECNLSVAYDYEAESYRILGARKGLDENGMADKNLRKLKAGDKITTLHYTLTISGDGDEEQQVEGEIFTVTDETTFAEADLGDGTFVMMFEMVDAKGNSMFSDVVTFSVENGEIFTLTDE